MDTRRLTEKLTKIQQDLKLVMIIINNNTDNNNNPSGKSRKLRSDKLYLTNSEKQAAYRKRKKLGGVPNDTPPNPS